jgi:hypothetical protein
MPIKKGTPLPRDKDGNVLTLPGKSYKAIDGRLIAPPPGANKITKETAREYQRRGVEKYRKAAADAILKEAQAIGASPRGLPTDAWAMLIGNQFVKILDSAKPRAADVELIGRAIGALTNTKETDDASPNAIPEGLLENADKLILIIQRSKELESGEIIDVTPN